MKNSSSNRTPLMTMNRQIIDELSIWQFSTYLVFYMYENLKEYFNWTFKMFTTKWLYVVIDNSSEVWLVIIKMMKAMIIHVYTSLCWKVKKKLLAKVSIISNYTVQIIISKVLNIVPLIWIHMNQWINDIWYNGTVSVIFAKIIQPIRIQYVDIPRVLHRPSRL